MYTQIVVGTDGTKGADIAVDAAIELARMTGATLHVVNAYKVVDGATMALGAEASMMTTGLTEANEASLEAAQEICDEVVERASGAGVSARPHPKAGSPADVLLKLAATVGADLVVVGNRGMSGARRFVLGSVPNKVSHHCPTSLLVVDTSPGPT